MNKKRFVFTSTFCALVIFASNVNLAFAEYKLLEEKVPWSGTTFLPYIIGIYEFAVAFVAIAALLMITIGGFYYITSAGNQAQAGTAKTIIKDALLGLIVVFVSWLVLNTINPDLVNAQLCGLYELWGTTAPGGTSSNCNWAGMEGVDL